MAKNFEYERKNRTSVPHLIYSERDSEKEVLRQYLRVVKSIFEGAIQRNPNILTELRRRAKLRLNRQNGLK